MKYSHCDETERESSPWVVLISDVRSMQAAGRARPDSTQLYSAFDTTLLDAAPFDVPPFVAPPFAAAVVGSALRETSSNPSRRRTLWLTVKSRNIEITRPWGRG